MDTQADVPVPKLFAPHPNLGDAVNHNFIASEVEGGVFLDQLPAGAVLSVQTRNRVYTLVNRGNGQALISGHPTFCPEPVLVHIDGSNWGGSMLKTAFIGRGMHLEFRHPDYRTVMTSCIVDVRAAPGCA
jgi:hypothetical protein